MRFTCPPPSSPAPLISSYFPSSRGSSPPLIFHLYLSPLRDPPQPQPGTPENGVKGSDIDTHHRADYNDPAGEVGYRMKKQGGNEGDLKGKKEKGAHNLWPGVAGLVGVEGTCVCFHFILTRMENRPAPLLATS